jgi:L-cystine uptake protein TcyP (sodium:dicarboxylate symporter family)
MITITAASGSNVAQQFPGATGAAKFGGLSLGASSQRALAALFAMTLVFCGGLFVFAPKSGTRRATAVFALMVFGVLAIASCGGGGSGGGGTPPPPASRTVNVLITGTAGSGAVASTNVTLTID